MEYGKMRGLAWSGAVAAAAFFLAPQAHATPWCPSASNNTISCSNCSRELTCTVGGLNLFITGNNVVLDGMGYGIYWAPQTTIKVTGIGTRIKNVNIYGVGEDAIAFLSQVSTNTPSYAENVYINGTNQVGIRNNSKHPLIIINTRINYTGWNGVYNWETSKKTNMSGSTIYEAADGGFASIGTKDSWISRNTITNSGQMGMFILNASGMLIENNTLNNNQYPGLMLNNAGGTFRYNNGSGNGNSDCDEQHGAGVSVVGYGNNFPVRTGAGCAP